MHSLIISNTGSDFEVNLEIFFPCSDTDCNYINFEISYIGLTAEESRELVGSHWESPNWFIVVGRWSSADRSNAPGAFTLAWSCWRGEHLQWKIRYAGHQGYHLMTNKVKKNNAMQGDNISVLSSPELRTGVSPVTSQYGHWLPSLLATTNWSHTVQCSVRTSLMNLCGRRQIYNLTSGCSLVISMLFISFITILIYWLYQISFHEIYDFAIFLCFTSYFTGGPKTKLTVKQIAVKLKNNVN